MRPHRLGIVSDTHGETLPDVVDVLRSAAVDLILHAGDIGAETVLFALEEIAPVVAVAGNGDESLYHRYPWSLRLHFGEGRIFLCHWYNNFGRIHPAYEQVVQEWVPQEAGGLPGLFLLKTVIPAFCLLLGLQGLALVGRSLLVLSGHRGFAPKEDETHGTV